MSDLAGGHSRWWTEEPEGLDSPSSCTPDLHMTLRPIPLSLVSVRQLTSLRVAKIK